MKRWVAALAALLVGVTLTVTITVVDEDGAGPAPPKPVVTVKTTVDGVAEKPGVQPVVVEVPVPVVEAATDEIHRGVGQGDEPELAFPQAAPSARGCLTRTVRNMSSRGGAAVREIVLHYTVGPNRPGLSDLDGTTTLANNPAAGVSWHFLVDREGNCYFSVPLTMKAWTQANANPFSVGIEIVNSGREPNLIDGAGLRKLGLVVSDTALKFGVPLEPGAVLDCAPVKAGIVDHLSLGPCGGGHHDVSPYPRPDAGLAERVGPVIEAAWAQRARDARRACRGVHAFRERRRAGGAGTPGGRAVFDARAARVSRLGLRCVRGAAVRG